MVMANVCFSAQKHGVQLTVGRATSSGAAASASTNIVSNVSPLALPSTSPNYYMAAFPEMGDANATPSNLHGSALDAPGSGTFYYTIWMSSTSSQNYSEMTVSLIVLNVLP
jgi:hypothetical protein